MSPETAAQTSGSAPVGRLPLWGAASHSPGVEVGAGSFVLFFTGGQVEAVFGKFDRVKGKNFSWKENKSLAPSLGEDVGHTCGTDCYAGSRILTVSGRRRNILWKMGQGQAQTLCMEENQTHPVPKMPRVTVTGKSPDSRQDVTSHPLGDTTWPRVCRARWPSVLVSMAIRTSESHMGTSERAGDAQALTPCHSRAHCPRQRKMPSAGLAPWMAVTEGG